jgi:histidine triad (HIT) family protein
VVRNGGRCIFCRIVAAQAERNIVFEDETALVVMDIAPVNPGHLLVISKEHFAYLADLDEETGAHLFRLGMRASEAVRNSGVQCEGVDLFLADGEAAGQEVFHVHLHVIPRFVGDRFRVGAEGGHIPRPRAELDAVAELVREEWPR